MIYGLLSILSALKEGLGAVNELILVNGSFLPLIFFNLCIMESPVIKILVRLILLSLFLAIFVGIWMLRILEIIKILILKKLFDFILEMIYILKYKDQA